jgi:hypothetical protein
MPAFPRSFLLEQRAATVLDAASRAQEAARHLRAEAEQRIIDSECRATKRALAEDKAAWRVYRRRRGEPAADFVPYLT